MRTLALLLTSTQLCALDLDGWIYCGPTGKYVRFHDIEYTFDPRETPTQDINHIYLNSFGTEVGVGLNLCSLSLAFKGSYTRLYSSHSTDKTLQQGSTSFSDTKLGGDFYTYEVKGSYLFQPLCNIPWGIYPLVAYNSDSIQVTILNFPGSGLPPGTVVNFINFKPTVTLRGPAIGFGTTYKLPYGFSLLAEGTWQWRRTTIAARNRFSFTIPTILTQSTRQESGYSFWAQGPKVDLNLEYAYYNWFIGVGGEWQYLKQLGTSEGEIQELDLIKSLQGPFKERQFSLSPQEARHFGWTNWNWRAYVGYEF